VVEIQFLLRPTANVCAPNRTPFKSPAPRRVLELQLLCARFPNKHDPGAAMEDAEQPSPELYRQAAQKLREESWRINPIYQTSEEIALAARFERMAAYFEAQCRHRAARDTNNE